MGTQGSGLICPSCRGEMVQCGGPESPWRCVKCRQEKSFQEGLELLVEHERRVDLLLSDPDLCQVDTYEAFLKKASEQLYPFHMLMTRVKYSLCGMYGRVEG